MCILGVAHLWPAMDWSNICILSIFFLHYQSFSLFYECQLTGYVICVCKHACIIEGLLRYSEFERNLLWHM